MATKKAMEAALRSAPLFQDLSARNLRQVLAIAETADFMAGASIVKEGTEGDSFFVILQGQARVVQRGKTVRRLLPGDHFGEISLVDGGKRTASVVSETPMKMLIVERRAFTKMLQVEPSVAVGLMAGLARMVRAVERGVR